MSNNSRKVIVLVLLAALLVAACGPSEEEIAEMTAAAASPTPEPTATPEPTPTATLVPIDVTVQVQDSAGTPITYALVSIPETGDDEPIELDEGGQLSLQDIDIESVTVLASAQGHIDTEQSASLERGPNEITITLEDDPFGLKPEDACLEGEESLYIEDFEDGEADNFQGITRPAWLFEQTEDHGFVLTVDSPEQGQYIALANNDFGNAIWRMDVRTTTGRVHLNWHQELDEANNCCGQSRYLNVFWPGNQVFAVRFSQDGDRQFGNRFIPANLEPVWQSVAITYLDGVIDIWVDDVLILGFDDDQPVANGSIGLEVPPEGSPAPVSFDNLSVCSLSAPYVPPTPEPEAPTS